MSLHYDWHVDKAGDVPEDCVIATIYDPVLPNVRDGLQRRWCTFRHQRLSISTVRRLRRIAPDCRWW